MQLSVVTSFLVLIIFQKTATRVAFFIKFGVFSLAFSLDYG